MPKPTLLKRKATKVGNVTVEHDYLSDEDVSRLQQFAAKYSKEFPIGENITLRRSGDDPYNYATTAPSISGDITVDVGEAALKSPSSLDAVLLHEARHTKQYAKDAADENAGRSVADPNLPSSIVQKELDAYDYEQRNWGKTGTDAKFRRSGRREYKRLYKQAKELGVSRLAHRIPY